MRRIELSVLLGFGILMSYGWEGTCKECLRCKKIEEERALQQAEHPQEAGYFEDYLSMKEDEKKPRGESSSNKKGEEEAGSEKK